MADPAAGLERLLTRKDLVELNIAPSTNAIAVGTHSGKFDDLRVIRIGRRCYYEPASVREFLDRHRTVPRERPPSRGGGAEGLEAATAAG